MKKILIILTTILLGSSLASAQEFWFSPPTAPFACGDALVDSRDSKSYSTVQIGTQCWMAENLAYLPSVSPSSGGSNTIPYYYVYDYQGTIVSAAKATSNYQTYGVLYNWPAAIAGEASSNSVPSGVQGICPDGWYLPSDAEWTLLTDYLGGSSIAGGKMKETGYSHWNSPNAGATNSSGFTARPGGKRNNAGVFSGIGGDTYSWSSTEITTDYAWSWLLAYDNSIVRHSYSNKRSGFSVRCLRDCSPWPTDADAGSNQTGVQGSSTTLAGNTPSEGSGLWSIVSGTGGSFADAANPTTLFYGVPDNTYQLRWTISNNCGSYYDDVMIGFASFSCGDDLYDSRDGNTYTTVQIGSQCWIAENLAYLPSVSPSSAGSQTTPYYYVYDYQGTNVSAAKATSNYQTYGVLYNWLAAMAGEASSNSIPSGVQGICPDGWYLPSDAEWTLLTNYLGGSAGGKMKETGYSHWNSPNAGAINSSGFTALPGG
ncbi:MAG: hypothetical protein GY746_05755, partial [Gammaproteobacteria bacterium]|nr:hypothetical protein [Gammaproteobacteria bacterium]